MRRIFTIGHSNNTLEGFINLLNLFRIDCVVDVRTTPHSKLHPQFDQTNLKHGLRTANIKYLHLGKEFGARHFEKELLSHGQVDFRKVRNSVAFKNGVTRLKDGVNKNFVITLLCAEANPLDCHRFSMISYQLVKDGIDVAHILKDGSFKTNAEMEKELLFWYRNLIQNPLLNSEQYLENENTAIEKAYAQKNLQIGFWPNGEPNQSRNYDKSIYDRIHK